MLGIVVALVISWMLLYLVERKNLLSLGVLPFSKRLLQFLIGFTVTTILCVSVQYLEAFLKSSDWHWNQKFSALLLLERLWWDVKSVLTEELIFRGALLYILIRKIGSPRAILISAIAFGVYHWFSFGIFGNVVAMFFVFVGTGLMGYSLALSFSKTNSILMPIGLHLGWNFTLNTVFSRGPLGDGLILSTEGIKISDWYSLIGLWGVPIVVLLFVRNVVATENDASAPYNVVESTEKIV